MPPDEPILSVMPAETPAAPAAAVAAPEPAASVPAAPPAAAAAPVAPVEPAPVAPASGELAASPVVPAAPDPKPADAPKAADPAKPTLSTDQPSLLETALSDQKPGDAPKPAEPVAAAPVAYQDFTVPEGLSIAPERMTEYTGVLGEYGIPQEAGQKLMDMHAAAIQHYADQTLANQHRVFNETRKGWNTEIMADEILGGSGHQTTVKAVARARDALVPEAMMAPRTYEDGSPRMSQYEEFLRVTGAGDHPVFWHILHNATRYLEPQAASLPANPRPPPSNGRRPGGRAAILYDNPSSRKS